MKTVEKDLLPAASNSRGITSKAMLSPKEARAEPIHIHIGEHIWGSHIYILSKKEEC